MYNRIGNGLSPQIQQLLNTMIGGAQPQPFGGAQQDPIQQLLGFLGQMQQQQQGGAGLGGGGMGGMDPRMLRRIIGQLDRQIVQAMLGQQGGAGGMGGVNPLQQFGQQQQGQFPGMNNFPGLGNCFPQNLQNAFPQACAPRPPCGPQPAPAPATPPPLPEIKGTAKGGWLADHGKYKKEGDKFILNDGRCATPVAGKPGQFTVSGPDGQPQGIFNAPGNANKIASPLTFDLNGDGKVSTTGTKNGKQIDLNGDGKVDQSAWAGKGDGVLAFGTGASGKQLLGNNTDVDGDGKADGYANGFQALGALAQKHLGQAAVADGKLDQNELAQLEQKANLHMDVDGQKRSLKDIGVAGVNLGYNEAGQAADENGNEHRQQGSFIRNDGQTGKVNDVWFKYE
jgi:hypothetical protein